MATDALTQRTIILTGGLGSLGAGLIKGLLALGADCTVLDLPASPTADANNASIWAELQTLASTHARTLSYVHCDVTAETSVTAAVEQACAEAATPVKGIVTLAGIAVDVPAIDHPMGLFRRVYEVNVFGSFMCATAVARVWRREERGGSVVLIASMSAHNANQGVHTSAYNSSKGAVVQLARSLASEWGVRQAPLPPIRVNSLSPGYIRTAMTEPVMEGNPALRTLWPEGNMLGRLSETGEYVSAVAFLLGDGSSYMTGGDLRMDGGHTAW